MVPVNSAGWGGPDRDLPVPAQHVRRAVDVRVPDPAAEPVPGTRSRRWMLPGDEPADACHTGAMSQENLLGEPAATLLPADGPEAAAAAQLAQGLDPLDVARSHPAASIAWAVLAEAALAEGADVVGYAFARTGYHRGLDALRRAGWRGHGPVPVSHAPNQGFLRAVLALAEAAAAIGETQEDERCRTFLVDCGTTAQAVRALR